MKRNLALLLLTSLLVCCTFGLIACNQTTHTHSVEKVEAKAATCLEAGNTEYYRCTGCDKLFSDEAHTTETTLEETLVAALGHDLEHHDAQAPSCTQVGWDAYDTCKRDGCEYTTKEVVTALNHDFSGTETVVTPATCVAKGSKTVQCTRCDATTTKDVEIDPNAHDMTPVAKKDATCTEVGYDAYEKCSRCDHNTKGADIPALKHDYSDTVIPPTYEEQGYTLHTCSRCGEEYKDTYTPIKHSCKSACLVCGGCKNASCEDDACKTKCTCKVLCEHACSTCGRCLDMNSTDDLCKEKCGDALQNSQKFEAEDDKVLKYPGTQGDSYVWVKPEISEETYVGGLAQNVGAKLKFIVESDKDGVASLVVSGSKRSTVISIADGMLITVNGTSIDTKASLPAISDGEVEWFAFVDVNIGCIQLKEGRNVIEFTITGDAFNFNAITVKSDLNVAWYTGAHICDDVCTTCGLCKNEYCVDPVCLDKCFCGMNKQEFNLSDGKATLEGLTLSDGVVNFTAAGQKVVYKIKSSNIAEAVLLLNVKANNDGLTTSGLFKIKINGTEVTVSATAVKNGDYGLIKACATELKKGNNEIEILSLGTEDVTLKGITLGCNETLEYVEESYYVVKVEAESADLTKVNVDGEVCPYVMSGNNSSGNSYLGGIGQAGNATTDHAKISFSITAEENCSCLVYFGVGIYDTANASSYVVLVNGTSYTSSEVWQGSGWTNWGSQYFGTVQLTKGDNLVEVRIDGMEFLNLDYFSLESLSSITIKSDDTDNDTTVYANVYKHEAEAVTSNRSESADLGERENETSSGGCHLGGVGEVSNANPGYYYFKWSITVDKACEVLVSMGIGTPVDLNFATAFPAKLGSETVAFDKKIVGSGWTEFRSYDLGTINLSAGENVFYIYIGEGALCNIDYFVFSSNETLTFNATSVDA